jgi:hypothetical protein
MDEMNMYKLHKMILRSGKKNYSECKVFVGLAFTTFSVYKPMISIVALQ